MTVRSTGSNNYSRTFLSTLLFDDCPTGTWPEPGFEDMRHREASRIS